MDGIEIPQEVAEAEGVPDDLDSSVLGPYRFPNPIRRRTAGVLYVVGAVLSALGALAGLPAGFWFIAAGFLLMAAIHVAAAWNLGIDQEAALERAATMVPFTVGHASAAVAFVGLRARPVWNVILYSAAEPPDQRALVRLDGGDGTPLEDAYVEDLASLSEESAPAG